MLPEFISLVRANNPGVMTLEGTNSYVIRTLQGCLVIDPGPLDELHLSALQQATDEKVSATLLTHDHPDHAEGAIEFANRVNSALFAVNSEYVVNGGEPLRDGFEFSDALVSLKTIATPGHTSDSVSFLATSDLALPALFTGDTILGSGTSVVAYPDGSVGDYLNSLDLLIDLVAENDSEVLLLPGHGPLHPSASPIMEYYREHRLERVMQMREVLAKGITDIDEIVDAIYPDLPVALRFAAVMSAKAAYAYVQKN